MHEGEGFKIKLISVDVGARMSLQSHRHRTEHWTVVRGRANITRGDKSCVLCENEGITIAPLVKHRLANGGNFTLKMVEIQLGSKLDEDDIVRYEDDYGRVTNTHGYTTAQ